MGHIEMSDAMSVVGYCFFEYLRTEYPQKTSYSFTDVSQFIQWAEMRFAPKLKARFSTTFFGGPISNLEVYTSDFEKVNSEWYTQLRDGYVKVSVMGKTVEFRIGSEDGFDWNEVIIGQILKFHEDQPGLRFNVLRESSKGYKAYFIDADVNDILENDKMILSSQLLRRKVIGGRIIYTEANLL